MPGNGPLGEQQLPESLFFLRILSDFGIMRSVAFTYPGNREGVRRWLPWQILFWRLWQV